MAPRKAQPKSVRPGLQWMVLCEATSIDDGGIVSLRRTFDQVTVPFLPVVIPVTLSIQYRGGTGTHKSWIRVQLPNGETTEAPEQSFWLESTRSAHRFDARIELPLIEEGTIWFTEILDGLDGMRIPLAVKSRGLTPPVPPSS